MTSCIGWDIGGAHVKAVLLDANGVVVNAMQVYCPLWRGLHELTQALAQVTQAFNAPRHAVTMTGELADIFENRQEGVMRIATLLEATLTGDITYYAGQRGFVRFAQVANHTMHIASMNWYASVQYVAQHVPHALFVDIGSTTTDIALIADAQPQVQGFSDAARMQSDELVYTGVVRTPLMALAQKIKFADCMSNVAAEHFATTADIYTLTGDLSAADNLAETADGAEKSHAASARRLARMVGMDANDAGMTVWQDLAQAFKQQHMLQIHAAVGYQISRSQNNTALVLVGCGVGAFLVAQLATMLGKPYVAANTLIQASNAHLQQQAAICFPAYTVAYLSIQGKG